MPGSLDTVVRPVRFGATLALFAAVMVIGGTDMTKVTVALPAVAPDLGLGPLETIWVADAYALAAGAILVPSAVLADRFGRKRIYIGGLVVAVLAALLATAAMSSGALILARIGQGVGSAMVIAGTVAIIRVTFVGAHRRALAYGAWTAGFSLGSALGPLLGGFLVEGAHWRWIFLLNVPALGVCAIFALFILRESKNPDAPPLDVASALLSAAAIGATIGGLKTLAQPQIPLWAAAAAITAGAGVSVAFLHRQLRMRRPFLDVRIFKEKQLTAAAIAIAATSGCFSGVLFIMTLNLQAVHGMSAIESGTALLPLAVACALGGVLAAALNRRFNQNSLIVSGVALSSAALLSLPLLDRPAQAASLVALGAGSGVVMTIGANALMSAAPAVRTADAGAVQESAFAIGAGGGIAVLGATSMYVGHLQGAAAQIGAHEQGATAALALGAAAYLVLGVVVAALLRSREPAKARP